MVAKKKKKTPTTTIPKGDKTAFVRKQPRSLPATKVQELAAKAGIEISVAYIHNIRCSSARIARDALQKKGAKKVPGNKAQKEKLFTSIVLDLGAARCRQLLEKLDAALQAQAE
jgi:hypothetical protein